VTWYQMKSSIETFAHVISESWTHASATLIKVTQDIDRSTVRFKLCQEAYIDVSYNATERTRPKQYTPLLFRPARGIYKRLRLRLHLGALMYFAVRTRLDIVFSVKPIPPIRVVLWSEASGRSETRAFACQAHESLCSGTPSRWILRILVVRGYYCDAYTVCPHAGFESQHSLSGNNFDLGSATARFSCGTQTSVSLSTS
jgi:hypothetical protein